MCHACDDPRVDDGVHPCGIRRKNHVFENVSLIEVLHGKPVEEPPGEHAVKLRVYVFVAVRPGDDRDGVFRRGVRVKQKGKGEWKSHKNQQERTASVHLGHLLLRT